MKTKFYPILAAAALVWPLSSALHANVNPAIVPADSKWVAYADFKQMRESVLGQRVLAVIKEKDLFNEDTPIQPDIAKIMETIGNLTAYGDNISGKPEEMDGALVIEGTAKLRTIAEGLVAHFQLNDPDQIVELTDLPFEAYRVNDQVVIGFPTEPIIVVSRSTDRLLTALATFRGQTESLAKQPGALGDMLPNENDYYFYGASVVPSAEMENGNSPEARILKMTKSASLRLGEVGGNVVANATLTAEDKDTATRLTKIVNGMTALLSLAQSEEADLVAFIDSVKVQQSDRRVAVQMGYPSEKLISLVESQMNREQNAKAASQERAAAKFSVEGELIAEWKSNTDAAPTAPEGFDAAIPVEHTTAAVTLAPGMILNVSTLMPAGEVARLDYLDLVPAEGGQMERFEAEFMRLTNSGIDKVDTASGGETIRIGNGRGIGRAQMVFRGAAGSYVIKVGYLKDSESVIHFKMSVVTPATSEE